MNENVCAATVAIAAPATPHFRAVIKKISSTILISVAAIKIYVGVLESPTPLRIFVRELYANVGTTPINIIFK